jgi:hypothetical protein
MDDLLGWFANFKVEKTDGFALGVFQVVPNNKKYYPEILKIY